MARDFCAASRSTPIPRNIDRAWEAAVCDAPVRTRDVRPEVLASWHRSRVHHVNPSQQRAPLDLRSLAKARRQHRELILAATPILLETGDLLGESGGIVLLCGPNGLVLESSGAPRILDLAVDTNIAPGGIWTEQACGTNAVGTALSEGRAVELRGAEHFCDSIRRWSCAASLLRHPESGAVIGALNVSHSGRPDTSVLPLAVTVARRIEGELVCRALRRQRFLFERYAERAARWPGDGLLLLDHDGRLLGWNECAERMMAARGLATPLARGIAFDPLLARVGAEHHEALCLDGEHAGAVLTIAHRACAHPHPAAVESVTSTRTDTPRLRDAERAAILAALQAESGRRCNAAARLGISRTTLYRRLLDYGIEAGDSPTGP
jgi:sigma-54 dependent transcriptional regulator, acetoin dehydrogenase operon transcriptional activator AcoR